MSFENEIVSSLLENTTVAAVTEEVKVETEITNIISPCGSDGNSLVLTSRLIEYISPYMTCNRAELMQLQEMLYSGNNNNSNNVLVDREAFSSVMKEWAGQIRQSDVSGNDFQQAASGHSHQLEGEGDFSFVQSTPNRSSEHHFLEGYSSETNFSIVSTSTEQLSAVSETNFSTLSASTEQLSVLSDTTTYENQLITELTNQNCQLTEELTQTKTQLKSREKQIENLYASLNEILQHLTAAQRANEQLKNQIKEMNKSKESSSDILLEYNELKQQKAVLEKEYTVLRGKYYLLDGEKHELLHQIHECNKREREWESALIMLNSEINFRNKKIRNLEDTINHVKINLKEHQRNYKQRSEKKRMSYLRSAIPKNKNGSENSEILPEISPQKPLTSFMLFYKALSKDAQDTKNEKPKEPYKVVWENMSPIDKVVWINWAAEEVKRYQKELNNGSYVETPTVKSRFLTKKARLLQERMAGKPLKPPNSAYTLFSTMMLRSDEIKSIHANERFAHIAQKWKLCSEDEKQAYKKQLDHLREQYMLDVDFYLKSLPEHERVEEELRLITPKRKIKGGNNKGIKKTKLMENNLLCNEEPKEQPVSSITLLKSERSGQWHVKDVGK